MTAAMTDRVLSVAADTASDHDTALLADAATRVVGRLARADEALLVDRMLRAYSTSEVSDEAPLAAVVALASESVVGVAAAWEGDPAPAAVAVAPDWLGYGISRFLARMLAAELAVVGVARVAPAPRSAKHTH